MATAKAGLTLNDLYDTTCITHSRLSNFFWRLHYHVSCSYQFIKVALTDYLASRVSSKMI